MGKHFEDIHEGPGSQLGREAPTTPDTEEMKALRASIASCGGSAEQLLSLAGMLVKQLRYREAVEVLDKVLALDPDNRKALRMRGIRRVYTLDPDGGLQDFLRLRELGYEEDLSYQVGLSYFYSGRYGEAASEMIASWDASDDEMKVASAFWEGVSSARCGRPSILLGRYHENMAYGHHTAYNSCCRLLSGKMGEDEFTRLMENEERDLEYSMLAYGLAVYWESLGRGAEAEDLKRKALERDSFWISFSYVAMWNEVKGGER